MFPLSHINRRSGWGSNGNMSHEMDAEEFPPFGLLVFTLLGAFPGEVLNGENYSQAYKAAFGTFVGLLFETMIKFSTTVIIAYYFFSIL